MEYNIIKGDINLSDNISKYYDYALKFYDYKYSDIFDMAIKSTYFYVCDENENLFDILSVCYSIINSINLDENDISVMEKISLLLNDNPAFYFKSFDEKKGVVVLRDFSDNQVLNLIHEFYCHAVSSQVNLNVAGYTRSGFRLANENFTHYDMFNEGFTEFFARCIYEMGGCSIGNYDENNAYYYQTLTASNIFYRCDHGLLKDSYITGDPNLFSLFKKGKMDQIERLLMTDSCDMSDKDLKKMNKLLNSVCKRKLFRR